MASSILNREYNYDINALIKVQSFDFSKTSVLTSKLGSALFILNTSDTPTQQNSTTQPQSSQGKIQL